MSYDVPSLFTNVPLDETIKILADRAFSNNWFNSEYDLNIAKQDLIDLLSVATKGQLFQFNGSLYEQVDGVAMGSPLGPLLANVFMSSIEEKLDVEGKLPPYYRRYVDDTFTVMPDLSTAKDFLNTLNHAHPAIKFTMEVEKDGMLPFLGALRVLFHRFQTVFHRIRLTFSFATGTKSTNAIKYSCFLG